MLKPSFVRSDWSSELEALLEGVQHADELGERLEGITSETLLLELLDYIENGTGLPGQWDVLFEEAHRISPAVGEAVILRALGGRLATLMAVSENPHLQERDGQLLTRGLIEQLKIGVAELSLRGRGAYLVLQSIYRRKMLLKNSPETAVLWSLVRRMSPSVDVDFMNPGKLSSGAQGEKYRQGMLTALAMCADMSAEDLLEIAERIGADVPASDLAFRLSLHPNANEKVWLALIERPSFPDDRVSLLQALATKRVARTHPEIRAALLREMRHNPDVMAALCFEAGEDTKKLFLELVKLDPQVAIEVLESPSFQGKERLSAADGLLPLLSHPDAKIRLAAIRAWTPVETQGGEEASQVAVGEESVDSQRKGVRR